MSSYIQKKFSIAHNHKDFLKNYKKNWDFQAKVASFVKPLASL